MVADVSRPPNDKRGDAPKTVRRVRTEHGTRVARAIVCSACGAEDRVHFAPRDAAQALCRKCAAQLLGVVDEASNTRPERTLTCSECGKEELTTWNRDDAPFQCKDCVQGIWTKQQDRSKGAERLGEGGRVLRVRRRGGPHDEA